MADRQYSDEIIEELLQQLEAGKSLSEICRDERMPNRRTVTRWQRGADELAERLADAIEIGYHEFAEETLRLVAECKDPMQARNILAARQWFLGKRSRAFADKPLVGIAVNVGADDTFDALSRVLEGAAGRVSSGRERTYLVDRTGEARPVDAGAGELDDLAGAGGPGLGQDPDGR
jgi:hypothetical protein